MALTLLPVSNKVPGSARRVVLDITCDSSYPEGGYPLSLAEIGLKQIDDSECTIRNGSESSIYRVVNAYHKEEKLHLIDSATGKELVKEQNMAKVVVRLVAHGH